MNILFLDDNIYRYDAFMKNVKDHRVCWAKTAQDAIDLLDDIHLMFDQVWLDHDLSDEHYEGVVDEETGRRVVKYICEHADKFSDTTFVVHTLNPAGGEAMCSDLKRSEALCKHRIYREPFSWTNKSFIDSLCNE